MSPEPPANFNIERGIPLPIATAFLWWAWRALQQERSIATQIVKELSRKFEGERWG
jgi:hypothetical protein